MRPALLWLLLASTALANREGFANAQQKAQRLERRGQWAEAAAWWEAAAETMEAVSAPLSALGVAEATEDRDEGARLWWQKYGEEDARVAKEARERAKAAWTKAGGESAEARAALGDFMVEAVANYPRNYWRWGHVELRMESLRSDGSEIGAWQLEARERARWAARYRVVCVAYWKEKGDEKRAAEFEAEAAEQDAKAEAARKRIAAEYEEGWDPEKLRGDLRTGTAEERRDAVSRLAFLGDRAGLKEAVYYCDGAAAKRAVEALVALRDAEGLAAVEHSRHEGNRKLADGKADIHDPSSGPEWIAVFRQLAADATMDRESRLFAIRGITGETPAEPNNPALYDMETKIHALWGKTTPGLRAEYFASGELDGESRSQTIEDLDFDWGREAPLQGLPVDGWSFRATGFVDVKEEKVAELLIQCEDAVRVRIDARPIIDQWAEAPEPLYRRAPVLLKKGLHSIVVEYADRGGLAALRIWLAPGRDEFVPLGPMLRRMPENK